MIYSFIKPEPKPLLNKFNTLCLFVFLSVVFIIIIFTIYIKIKQEFIYSDNSNIKMTNQKISKEIKDLKDSLDLNKNYVALIDDVNASNTNLKKSIKNLFDLVPDSIVLSEVLMEQKSLLIKGATPTKDIYKNLLETPLKSIFETTKTNYLQLESGWYNFVSINTIENSEGFNE